MNINQTPQFLESFKNILPDSQFDFYRCDKYHGNLEEQESSFFSSMLESIIQGKSGQKLKAGI